MLHASEDCFQAETIVLACQFVHLTERTQVKDSPESKTTKRYKKLHWNYRSVSGYGMSKKWGSCKAHSGSFK
jgi:predicted metal-dependent hydrolase